MKNANNEYLEQATEIINAGLYDAAVQLMDDEIRERLSSTIAPCTETEFIQAYMVEHQKKYGMDFII